MGYEIGLLKEDINRLENMVRELTSEVKSLKEAFEDYKKCNGQTVSRLDREMMPHRLIGPGNNNYGRDPAPWESPPITDGTIQDMIEKLKRSPQFSVTVENEEKEQ